MSYNSNTEISFPGELWDMLWPNSIDNFQLDIVGFLAILGESSILANAQVSALSSLSYLPRLLPAPQALLRVTRPVTLPSEKAVVTAVKSGNKKEHLHHVANVLLGTSSSELKKHWVRCVRITKNTEVSPEGPTRLDRFLRGQAKQKQERDAEGELIRDIVTIKAKAAGPLTWVTLLGFSLTVIIMVVSVIYGDGMSLMATISLSLLSSICGIANKWELSLTSPPKPKKSDNANRSKSEDMVVIRYPEGKFLVVRCTDEIARELFFAPEEITYTVKSSSMYRLLALVGSVALMIGVILLANARLQLQLAWASAYLILNAAHWAAAALPARMHWDLSYYKLEEEGIEGGPENRSFMEALWKVILITKRVEWVHFGDAAPHTKVWSRWAQEASNAAKSVETSNDILPLGNYCRSWTGSTGKGKLHRLPKDEFDVRKIFKHNEDEVAREEDAIEQEEAQMLRQQATAGATRPAVQNGNAGG